MNLRQSVAQAFQPAGSRDIPVPCFCFGRLESRPNRQTGMSALRIQGSRKASIRPGSDQRDPCPNAHASFQESWIPFADSAIQTGVSKLADKVLVVMGGTTGIGFSAAKAFVEAGAKVVVVGRNAD